MTVRYGSSRRSGFAAQGLLAMLVAGLADIPATGYAADTDALDGRAIVDQMTERHEQPYELEIQKMTLIDRAGNAEERELRRYVREDEDGEFKYLVVFHSPAGVKGVAVLTWQHADKDDDQWLYLPAYKKKMKRIAKGGRKNYFMGTDYTFEDLVSESVDKFVYERKPDETIDDVAYFVVDIRPKDKKVARASAYGSRRIWVRQDMMLATITEYFDKRDKLIKRQTLSEIENVTGDVWRANLAKMENLAESHTTEIRVSERRLEEKAVPAENFRQRFVTSGKHVR